MAMLSLGWFIVWVGGRGSRALWYSLSSKVEGAGVGSEEMSGIDCMDWIESRCLSRFFKVPWDWNSREPWDWKIGQESKIADSS